MPEAWRPSIGSRRLNAARKSPRGRFLSRWRTTIGARCSPFYLNTPPRRGDRGPDFRTLRVARSSETEALIDALVRNLQSRQSMVRAALEAEDEAEHLPFVGVLLRSEGVGTGWSKHCAKYSNTSRRLLDCHDVRRGPWLKCSATT